MLWLRSLHVAAALDAAYMDVAAPHHPYYIKQQDMYLPYEGYNHIKGGGIFTGIWPLSCQCSNTQDQNLLNIMNKLLIVKSTLPIYSPKMDETEYI
ncbi:hypothetical protein HanIR_Chr12g0561381 [Helianthus annuus]|nr:hypothetical protein HanIR_Chr12g0561381 [Helianthus annuus]